MPRRGCTATARLPTAPKEDNYKTFQSSSASAASRPVIERYSRFRIARPKLKPRSTSPLARPSRYSGYAWPNFSVRCCSSVLDRGADGQRQVDRNQHRRGDTGRCDREAEAHQGRPGIERMPRQPVRSGSRHLLALLQVPGGPDPQRLSGDARSRRQSRDSAASAGPARTRRSPRGSRAARGSARAIVRAPRHAGPPVRGAGIASRCWTAAVTSATVTPPRHHDCASHARL